MVSSKVLTVSRSPDSGAEKAKSGYVNNIEIKDQQLPELKDHEVLVRIHAAGFNHREVS